MPEVFRRDGWKYFFYANEGTPREPPHVHVRRGRDEAKYWLHPFVRLAYNDGLSQRELRDTMMAVVAERDRIERVWHEFFA